MEESDESSDSGKSKENAFSIIFTGNWNQIVNAGEDVEEAMKDSGFKEEEIDKWEYWRPKKEEELEEDMTEKSVEKSSIGDIEEKPGEPTSENIDEIKKSMKEDEKQIRESVTKSIKDLILNSFNRLEKLVYSLMVRKKKRKYFNSEQFHTSLSNDQSIIGKIKNKIFDKEEEEFSMELYFEQKEKKEEVQDNIE